MPRLSTSPMSSLPNHEGEDLQAANYPVVGWSLADLWLIVGWPLAAVSGWSLADRWPIIGWSLADRRLIVGWSLADRWLIVDWSLADRWLTVGWPSADRRLTVGWPSADRRLTVGWPSTDRRLTVAVAVAVNTDEHRKLQQASTCSKAILSFVNQAVKDCENHNKLVELQRRLDKRPIENSLHSVVADYKVGWPQGAGEGERGEGEGRGEMGRGAAVTSHHCTPSQCLQLVINVNVRNNTVE